MSLKLSSNKIVKMGYGSEPTPDSVKENVKKLEKVLVREVSDFGSFANDKKEFKELLAEIQTDIRTVRPILEYISNVDKNGEQRAFKESNLKDTYDRYNELTALIFPEKIAAAPDMPMEEDSSAEPSMEGPPIDEAVEDDPLNSIGNEEVAANVRGLHLLKSAMGDNAEEGLSDKIEKLYFLGRIDNIEQIKRKVLRAIKIGDLLVKAIDGEGRPTLDAVEELNSECNSALSDITVVESAVDAMSALPDKLENISDLLKSSLLVRIQEIRGNN